MKRKQYSRRYDVSTIIPLTDDQLWKKIENLSRANDPTIIGLLAEKKKMKWSRERTCMIMALELAGERRALLGELGRMQQMIRQQQTKIVQPRRRIIMPGEK